mmetsp:Transcript_11554/g.35621  ORF Transcript_11554/g.35621 Transcript_11554/m.35621 type:complete len:271 (-) Transcript_11554:978-1790(-)
MPIHRRGAHGHRLRGAGADVFKRSPRPRDGVLRRRAVVSRAGARRGRGGEMGQGAAPPREDDRGRALVRDGASSLDPTIREDVGPRPPRGTRGALRPAPGRRHRLAVVRRGLGAVLGRRRRAGARARGVTIRVRRVGRGPRRLSEAARVPPARDGVYRTGGRDAARPDAGRPSDGAERQRPRADGHVQRAGTVRGFEDSTSGPPQAAQGRPDARAARPRPGLWRFRVFVRGGGARLRGVGDHLRVVRFRQEPRQAPGVWPSHRDGRGFVG